MAVGQETRVARRPFKLGRRHAVVQALQPIDQVRRPSQEAKSDALTDTVPNTAKLDFIHLNQQERQGKLRQISAKRNADANPAQGA